LKDVSGTKTAVPATSGVVSVQLGETIYLQAKIKGDLDVETAFKFCKICKTATCAESIPLMDQYSGGTGSTYGAETAATEQTNCVRADIRGNSRFVITVPKAGDGNNFAEFQFPAFRYSASTGNKLYLKCQLAICNREAGSSCRKKCGSTSRKRRSADSSAIKPLEATATLALKVEAPSAVHCPSTKRVKGTSRLTCTNGTKVGSVCRQVCAPGFAANMKGLKTAMRVCQEQITDSIGQIYFGTKPAWTPDTPGCNDVNECLQNPCQTGSICQNTVGSYYCQWLN